MFLFLFSIYIHVQDTLYDYYIILFLSMATTH